MSIQALAWAFDQEVFPPSHKFVLIALANHVSDRGKTYPGVPTICNLTGHKEETVRNALTALVESGLIIDTGKRAGSTGQIRVFQFPDDAWQRPPARGVLCLPKDPPKTPPKTPLRPPFSETPIYKEPGTGNREPCTPLPPQGDVRVKFQKPGLEEMKTYGLEIKLPEHEVSKCFDFYSCKGWVVGKAPMKDWKAAMRNWKRTWEERGGDTRTGNSLNGSAPLSPGQLKLVIDAKGTKAKELYNRHCNSCGLNVTWDNPAARAQYAALKKEIRELTDKLGSFGMATMPHP